MIDGVSVYRAARPAHWHLVTFGLSELYAKESDEPAVSGWGFELTMRVPRQRGDQAPLWALGLLQGIAKQTHVQARRRAVGDRIDVEGPIIGQTTALTALLMAEDPHLGTIDTPHGRLQFLQMVGITADELAFARQAGSDRLLEWLGQRDPLLLTDLERASVLSGRRPNGQAHAMTRPLESSTV